LAAEPDVLIADEATTALDVTTQAQILELIRDLSKKNNVTVVIVTHNLGLIARYADRIYVMYSGHIVESGEKFEIFEHPSHPYTRGLLNAVPRLDDNKTRKLVPIEGLPPNPSNMPPYCRFYDRCLYREDRCKERMCALEPIAQDHYVRCCLSAEELDKKRSQIEGQFTAVPVKALSNEVCLEVRDLKMYYPLHRGVMKIHVGDIRAVDGVSFQVYTGETLGIVGESGCGKSTLARCIMRANKPTSGQILYRGTDVAPLKNRALKPFRSKITMIFQDPFSSLDPRQTAGSIVGEPLEVNKLTKTRAEYNDRVDELFKIVGLDPDYRSRLPREFSGGQRQRLGIARALASSPDVIICDEPVSALDVSIQAQIINLLEELQAQMRITYLFIAHDLSVVKHISDRIMVMYLGTVVEESPAELLYSNPLHPYTKALLSAVPISDPKVDARRERIKLIGEVPSVMERIQGCPFWQRCQYATERCKTEKPRLSECGGGQRVACFLYE
jgi:peptide/nickel transport system ATP-binding protein